METIRRTNSMDFNCKRTGSGSLIDYLSCQARTPRFWSENLARANSLAGNGQSVVQSALSVPPTGPPLNSSINGASRSSCQAGKAGSWSWGWAEGISPVTWRQYWPSMPATTAWIWMPYPPLFISSFPPVMGPPLGCITPMRCLSRPEPGYDLILLDLFSQDGNPCCCFRPCSIRRRGPRLSGTSSSICCRTGLRTGHRP